MKTANKNVSRRVQGSKKLRKGFACTTCRTQKVRCELQYSEVKAPIKISCMRCTRVGHHCSFEELDEDNKTFRKDSFQRSTGLKSSEKGNLMRSPGDTGPQVLRINRSVTSQRTNSSSDMSNLHNAILEYSNYSLKDNKFCQQSPSHLSFARNITDRNVRNRSPSNYLGLYDSYDEQVSGDLLRKGIQHPMEALRTALDFSTSRCNAETELEGSG